jgi:hypothetical protein
MPTVTDETGSPTRAVQNYLEDIHCKESRAELPKTWHRLKGIAM